MVRLRDELDREREERNFFQLERDKVNGYWDISKRQLDEARSTIRNKERELEDAEERHQVEIKVGIKATCTRLYLPCDDRDVKKVVVQKRYMYSILSLNPKWIRKFEVEHTHPRKMNNLLYIMLHIVKCCIGPSII